MSLTPHGRSFYDEPTVAWSLRTVGPHLHPGGEEATVLLAQRATRYGFPTGTPVLDLGCGLGAPGRFVARRFAVDVIGLDSEVTSTRKARDAAAAEGVGSGSLVTVGDGEALPFRAKAFEGVWSQDALCHMRKRPALSEIARVTQPGGVLAFTDWIARKPLTPGETDALRRDWQFPSLLRVSEYVSLLQESGFDTLLAEDTTYLRRGHRALAPSDQGTWETAFIKQFGSNELVRYETRLANWVALLDANKAGNGLFIARRRTDGAGGRQ